MNAVSPPPLHIDEREGYVILTLDRPATRNPLSEAMLSALTECFTSLAKRNDIRAVILAANGPVFSAGHDLKEMTAHRADPDRGRAYFEDILNRCAAMMQMILKLPQPVIAAIEGVARPPAVNWLPHAIWRLRASMPNSRPLVCTSDSFAQRRWLLYRAISRANMLWKCSY